MESKQPDQGQADRRTFLTTFGKAAVVAPPVVTALLSTSLSSPAIAASAGSAARLRKDAILAKRNGKPKGDELVSKKQFVKFEERRKPRGPSK